MQCIAKRHRLARAPGTSIRQPSNIISRDVSPGVPTGAPEVTDSKRYRAFCHAACCAFASIGHSRPAYAMDNARCESPR
jgi:hypothetical protein